MAASTLIVSMVMPLTHTTRKMQPNTDAFLKPLPVKPSNASVVSKLVGKFEVKASLKEKLVTGLTAGALTTSMLVLDVAEAANRVSPLLKNFLLSIVVGGVVLGMLGTIIGAMIGV
ncbi:photosystem II subunit X [Abeliophyllum distichum]|uniref:Photosystem II subunit X n=1 Tax=Abeliophyllum distichum TaxID=126358 RepID=A0ABD1QF65_9LAMI